MNTSAKVELRCRPPYQMGLEDLMKFVFWKSERTKSKARKLLKKIAEEGIQDNKYEEVQEELDLSNTQYYNIINRLQAVGLISKQEDENGFKVYRLSKRFSKQLESLASIWRNWVKQA